MAHGPAAGRGRRVWGGAAASAPAATASPPRRAAAPRQSERADEHAGGQRSLLRIAKAALWRATAGCEGVSRHGCAQTAHKARARPVCRAAMRMWLSSRPLRCDACEMRAHRHTTGVPRRMRIT